MSEQKMLENIKNSPRSGLEEISDEELSRLLHATIDTIDSILEDGNIVEIDDFGSFSRRKQGINPVSFFKPSEKLITRINRNKRE